MKTKKTTPDKTKQREKNKEMNNDDELKKVIEKNVLQQKVIIKILDTYNLKP